MLLSKEAQDKRVDKWLDENLTPIGEDPLEMVTVCKMRASKSPVNTSVAILTRKWLCSH